MYTILTHLYSDIEVFKNDVELLKLKRSNSFGTTNCKIFSNESLLIEYTYFTFLCFTKINIKYQNLNKLVKIEKKFCNFSLMVNVDMLLIKISLFPFFNKDYAKVYLNNIPIGKIKHKFVGLPDKLTLQINEDYKLYETYILTLLLMKITHSDSE